MRRPTRRCTGCPHPNHKFFEAHPTQSVELPLRLGSGDVTPKPNVARLDGDTVHFVDGTRRTSTSSSTRPATTSRSRSSTRSSSARRTTRSGCTSGCSGPASTTSRSSASRRRCRRCSRSSSARRGCWRRTPWALRAAVGRRDGTRHRRGRAQLHRPLHRQRRGTPSRSTTSIYEHDLRTREIPAGIERGSAAPAGWRAHEVADRPATAATQRPAARGASSSARPAGCTRASLDAINIAEISQAGRRHPVGVLLLLREQGRRRGGTDGTDGRRDVRGQRRVHLGDRPAGPAHRRHARRPVRRPANGTATCSGRCSTRGDRALRCATSGTAPASHSSSRSRR